MEVLLFCFNSIFSICLFFDKGIWVVWLIIDRRIKGCIMLEYYKLVWCLNYLVNDVVDVYIDVVKFCDLWYFCINIVYLICIW